MNEEELKCESSVTAHRHNRKGVERSSVLNVLNYGAVGV